MSAGFINIHTHQPDPSAEICLHNFIFGKDEIAAQECFSIGAHPWYLEGFSEDDLEKSIKTHFTQKQIIAIGECGLDKVSDTPWEVQLRFFTVQVKIANELELPLIIHCVRAFEEVMEVLQKFNSKVPFIFHGFSKGLELAKSLQDRGAYLSFGKSILKRDDYAWLANVNFEKIFFETDSDEIKVEEVYYQFSKLSGLDLDRVRLQIQRNFQKVFNNERH